MAGLRAADRRIGAALFAFFLSLFWITNSGFDTSEGGYDFELAEHIVAAGELGFNARPEGVFAQAPNGRWYASHEIGNTLFFLPAAFLNRTVVMSLLPQGTPERERYVKGFVISFQAGLCMAVVLTAFFGLLRGSCGVAVAEATLSTLLLGLTTYVWTYSRILFDGVLCCVFLTLSAALLLRYRVTGRRWLVLGAFTLLGMGVVTRISMVVAVVASLAYLVAVERSRPSVALKLLLIAAIVLVPFAAWQMWYNDLRTGTPLLSPVQTAQYAANNALDGPFVLGLAGLVASPGKSIFVYAPLSLMSVVLFGRFRARFPAEAVYVAVLTGLWLLLHAKLRSWYGAWGWGPRHFVTITPILLLPFAVEFWRVRSHPRFRRAAQVLAAWGLLLALSSIVSNWHFRMGLASHEHRLDDDRFVWSLTENQAVDMVRALPGNVLRWFGQRPLLRVPGASPLNTYASSTVNVWPNTAIHAGAPAALVALVGALLGATVIASGLWVARCALRGGADPPQGRE